jgi:HlyD family secretion protein
LLLVSAAAGGGYWFHGREPEAITWRTAQVERQDVRVLVTATGPIEAVQTVEVGAQVSGIIAALGADFNDRVTRGQVLARIDPTLLQADVAGAEARLAEAKAQAARLALALERVERLHPQRITTDDELDAARAEHAVASAQVQAAKVSLDRATRNLGYATITAPIDGTVIRRDVEVGQTVNAGFSAPKLFLLAGDLARMRILAAVDESDIGRIQEGQPATFTVQAWPDRTFQGSVRQVRLQSATAESVVTYTVVVDVDNADGALLPGMTATVEFEVERAEQTLCVPNAALRFKPDEGVAISQPPEKPAEKRVEAGGQPGDAGTPGPGGGEAGGSNTEAVASGSATGPARTGGRGGEVSPSGRPQEGRGRGGGRSRDKGGGGASIYVPEGDGLRAVPVTIGLRGAACVAVSGEGVEEGMTVVTGVERGDASAPSSPLGGGGGGGGQRRPGSF